MAEASIKKLQQKRAILVQKLVANPGFVRGSFIVTSRRGKDDSRRTFRFLSRRVDGINKSTYASEKQAPAFKAATKLYLKTADLIEKICEINIGIIRKGGTL